MGKRKDDRADMTPFSPGWCIHPGTMISSWLDEHPDVNLNQLRGLLGWSSEDFYGVISGVVPINDGMAHTLSAVVGGPPRLWISFEGSFRFGLAQGLTWAPFYRADSKVTCSRCELSYGEHELAREVPNYRGKPYLRRLCNGDLVKL
jgi:plasmid maintenance system antidote protein VapI